MSGVHQSTHGISVQILPTVINFTTIVLWVDVDIDLIHESNNLHIVLVIEYWNAGHSW